ncbi:MBL fold metallo-hydrolase [Haladaptatus sp. DFWS20]|uniref:MBL fold metallo-hydrolase n=1 Tax=Haladaptatus sp. DFWS20 TaxID=3403467 RepID=UPI003EB80D2C
MSGGDFPEPNTSVESLDPERLRETIDRGDTVSILDVRSESEYDTWHIEGENVDNENIPYYEFIEGVDAKLLTREPHADRLVVVCAKGGASEYVAGLIEQEGRNAVNLAHGMNGWANIYDAYEITRYEGSGTVLQYQRPSSGCLGYLVYHNGEACVVDPLEAFTERYRADTAELGVELKYAIDTHIHADHISGVRRLSREGIEAVLPAPAVARGFKYGSEYTTVEDGDKLSVGDAEIEVLHTPGHTTGMTSYLIDGSVLLTGDGLFTESIARPDLEEGTEGAPSAARVLHQTLHDRILILPDQTTIAPGHVGPTGTAAEDGTYTAQLGTLRESMAVLSMERDEFVDFILSDMPPRPANFETIIAINLGQQDVDDERAFELELGPNNCAATPDAVRGA